MSNNKVFYKSETAEYNNESNANKGRRNRKKDGGAMLFYVVMFAVPLIQFFIFYVVVNFNSILLAFQDIELIENEQGLREFKYNFVWFETIKRFITIELQSSYYSIAIRNSLINAVFSILVVIPIGLLFSYYIFKNYLFAKLFKIFLFLPSVICGLIFAIFNSYIADMVIPIVVKTLTGQEQAGLLSSGKTAFTTLLILNFWFSFGPSTLVYVNAMTQIDKSVVEASEIDGAGSIKQFFSVVLPMIFPSIVSYIIICIAQLGINQLGAFSYYAEGASEYNAQSIGYNLFTMILNNQRQNYTVAAAGGVFFTLIITPITLLIRFLLEKYGPSEN